MVEAGKFVAEARYMIIGRARGELAIFPPIPIRFPKGPAQRVTGFFDPDRVPAFWKSDWA